DQDNVLGLVLVQLVQDSLLQRSAADGQGGAVFGYDGPDRVHLMRRVGDGGVLRVVRGRGGQLRAPKDILKRLSSTNGPRGHAEPPARRMAVEDWWFKGAVR